MTGPRSLPGGYPSPRWGTPQDGVPLSRTGWGIPWPGQDVVPTPLRDRMGYPLSIGYARTGYTVGVPVRLLRFPAEGLSG